MQTRFSHSLCFVQVLIKCCFQLYSSVWLENFLDVDDMTSHIQFSDVPWPSLYFIVRSVFCRPLFYRLVCKIVNLWDVDLKFLGQISDINIDYPTQIFWRHHVQNLHLQKTGYLSVFRLFWPIVYRPDKPHKKISLIS